MSSNRISSLKSWLGSESRCPLSLVVKTSRWGVVEARARIPERTFTYSGSHGCNNMSLSCHGHDMAMTCHAWPWPFRTRRQQERLIQKQYISIYFKSKYIYLYKYTYIICSMFDSKLKQLF